MEASSSQAPWAAGFIVTTGEPIDSFTAISSPMLRVVSRQNASLLFYGRIPCLAKRKMTSPLERHERIERRSEETRYIARRPTLSDLLAKSLCGLYRIFVQVAVGDLEAKGVGGVWLRGNCAVIPPDAGHSRNMH